MSWFENTECLINMSVLRRYNRTDLPKSKNTQIKIHDAPLPTISCVRFNLEHLGKARWLVTRTKTLLFPLSHAAFPPRPKHCNPRRRSINTAGLIMTRFADYIHTFCTYVKNTLFYSKCEGGHSSILPSALADNKYDTSLCLFLYVLRFSFSTWI